MSTEVTKNFADILGQLVSESGKSLKKLAEEIGVSYGSISKYQNDNAAANIDALCKFADYFGVSTDYLLGRTEIKKPNAEIQAISGYIGISEQTIDYLHMLKTNPFEEDKLRLISDLFSDPRMKTLIPLFAKYVGLLSGLTDISFSRSEQFKALKEELDFYGYEISLPEDQANALFSERIINLLRTMLNDIAGERQAKLIGLVKARGEALLNTEAENHAQSAE